MTSRFAGDDGACDLCPRGVEGYGYRGLTFALASGPGLADHAIGAGLLAGTVTWFVLPLLLRVRSRAWGPAGGGTLVQLPVMALTLGGAGEALAGRATSLDAPWTALMLIGLRPLALIGGVLLVAAVVVGLWRRPSGQQARSVATSAS